MFILSAVIDPIEGQQTPYRFVLLKLTRQKVLAGLDMETAMAANTCVSPKRRPRSFVREYEHEGFSNKRFANKRFASQIEMVVLTLSRAKLDRFRRLIRTLRA
jgi:hypothetical protein